MSISELINEIVTDWAYRVDDGMPNPNNPMHVTQLEYVLSEMGLGHVKHQILEGLRESINEAEEGGFTNPALNKKVRYKNDKGEDKEGIVGNLLRQPEDSPGRKAAEAALPPEGSPERDAMNQELGSEKDGKAKAPEDGKGKEGEDEKGGGADAEAEKQKKAAAMFDPKADPAMAARLDREKAANDKLAQKDKEDADAEKQPTPGSPEDFKNKADKVAKQKEEAKKKGYDDSLHAMSDNQLDAAIVNAEKKMHDAQKSGDDKAADKANTEYAQHKVEQEMRKASKSGDKEIADAAVGNFLARKKDYEEKYGEPYKADIPYPDSDGGERTSAKWGDETPAGPEAGPNAEPPMDEPSKPDTTPPTDAEEPKDGEEPPAPAALGDKPEETKIDKATSDLYDLLDKAESDANDIESLKKLQSQYPELFANTGLDWDKMDPDLLNQVKNTKDIRDRIKQNAKKEKTKEQTTKAASNLKKRKTADGENLDVETTNNGSMIIGVEHGEGTESTKKTIEDIQKLPKDTKVMFVGEGGMTKDNDGNLELAGEQAEIRDAVKGHFDNAEEGSWDENANVYDDNSPVYKELEKELGSPSKSKAAIWSNMVGQGDDMSADDYLDDEGKAWIVDQAKKAGATNITDKTDFNNLTDAEKKDLYELNYNDEGKMGDNEIMKGQAAYNGFRQKELDRKIKEAEANGYTVIAPVGNSHVDMWRQRNKSQQKPKNQSTDSKPEDKPEEKPAEEPKTAETPKATKDDIKKEKPGKEAKTDSGGSLYSIGGGYYSDKPNGPAKYVRTESVIEMAFDNSLNEDIFALFEKTITGTLQNGEKITVQELPPRAIKKATKRAKAAAASSKEEPAQAAPISAEKPTSTTAEKPAEQPKDKTGFEPIPDEDVKKDIPKADPKVFGGESDIPDGIDKKDLNKFNTDINKVKQIVDDAKAKGEPMPDINLCDVTVPGTNLYCDGNLGIKRKAMPQFKGKPVPGSKAEKMPLNKDGEVDTEPVFREMLKEKGITTKQTEVPADQLKATQSELGGDKVIGMMGALEENPQHPSITGPIYVSRDGYVIDGHHRWAAIVAYNAQHPDAQIPMKCEVIDMDIKDAIPMCNEFAQNIGIAAKKQGETTGKAGEEQPKKATSMPPEAPADATPEKKSWLQRQKDKVINGIKKWTKSEKEFFDRGGHKPGSEPRRSFGKMLLDKAKGVGKAIVHGLKHEYEVFKTAGNAIYEAATNRGRLGVMKKQDGSEFHWRDAVSKGPDGKYEYEEYPDYEVDSHGHAKKGPDGKYIQKVDSDGKPKTKKRPKVDPNATDEEKELFLKSYNDSKYKQKCMMKAGKAILITGLTAAATGGLAHGGVAFLKHVAVELVPHVTMETVAIGTGKAALFAGAAEMDMQKHLEKWGSDFMKKMADTMANKKIPIDVMARAVESYNKEKENTQQKSEMKIESLIKEIISEVELEAKGETFTAIKKDTGVTSVFRSKEARDAAVQSGTHKMPKGSKEAPKKVAGSGMTYRQTPDMKKKVKKVEPKPTTDTEPDFSKMKPAQLKKFVEDRIAKVESEFDKSKNKSKYATDFMLKRQAEINSNYLRPAGSPASSLGENNGGKYINQIWKKGGNLSPQEEDAIINEIMETPLAQEIPPKDRKRWAKIALETAKTEVKVLMYQSKYKAAKKQTPPYPMGVIMDKQSKSMLKKHFVEMMKNAKTPKQKQHYQKQLDFIDKLTESDTGVMYEREDGTVGFKHTSNKSAYNDPHNNTSVDEKIKAMNQSMGGKLDPKLGKKMQDVSKKVAEASAGIEDACRKFSDSRNSMKPNEKNAQDAIIAKVVSAFPVRGGGKKNYLDECKGKPWFDKKAAELGIKTPVESEKDAATIAIACAGDTPAPTAALKVLIKVSEMLEKVTPETASKLAPAFNLSPDELLNLANTAGILKSAAKTRRDVMGEAHTELVTEIQKADKATKPPSYPYDKNADNGPHQQAYVKDFLHRMHFSSYILGERDGVSSQNIGGDNVEPEYYRQCLAQLSGYTGELDTPEGRQGLVSHLEKRVRVSPKDDSIVFVNGKTKSELGKEVYRTKGESKSVVSGLGKEMQGCLKGKAKEAKK